MMKKKILYKKLTIFIITGFYFLTLLRFTWLNFTNISDRVAAIHGKIELACRLFQNSIRHFLSSIRQISDFIHQERLGSQGSLVCSRLDSPFALSHPREVTFLRTFKAMPVFTSPVFLTIFLLTLQVLLLL